MNNTNNFSEFSSGAIEPRNQDLSDANRQEAASVDSYPATITKTDLENFIIHTDAITKDAENISQDSRAISDYLDSFSSLMVHPDGSLADLSDRGGRKDMNVNYFEAGFTHLIYQNLLQQIFTRKILRLTISIYTIILKKLILVKSRCRCIHLNLWIFP